MSERRYQFGIRSLLILTAVTGVFFAILRLPMPLVPKFCMMQTAAVGLYGLANARGFRMPRCVGVWLHSLAEAISFVPPGTFFVLPFGVALYVQGMSLQYWFVLLVAWIVIALSHRAMIMLIYRASGVPRELK